MRRLFLALFTILLGTGAAAASVPADSASPPWIDGESLTYLVTWETFQAAEGTFTAREKGDHWEFDLALASRGMVDTFYPFSADFWCILGRTPWRSVEYGEFRFEPRRVIKERTRIDYAAKQGTREQWTGGKTKIFSIDQPALDDVGTMLYHLRAGPWKPGDKRTLYVYESAAEKQAEAECEARETRAFGSWPAQPVLRFSVRPTVGTIAGATSSSG